MYGRLCVRLYIKIFGTLYSPIHDVPTAPSLPGLSSRRAEAVFTKAHSSCYKFGNRFFKNKVLITNYNKHRAMIV